MASMAACLRSIGRGKIGKSLRQIHAPFTDARRVISRITDSVKCAVRWLRNKFRGRRQPPFPYARTEKTGGRKLTASDTRRRR